MKQYLHFILSLFLAFTSCQPSFALTKIPNSMLLGPTTLTAVSGTLGIANGGTGQTSKTPAFNALSPLTTKGDLLVAIASGDNTRKAVGTDGQVLVADSSDSTGVKWSTLTVSGGGAVNLITNGEADNVVSSILVPYQDSSGTRPSDGTGGTPTGLTTAVTSTAPLTGTKSFTITKDAANRQGGGWAIPFTVPLSMQAKVLQIEVDYIVNSGTFVAGSSSTDSDVIWYLYDVTNSTLIEPSSIRLLSNSSTLSDKFRSTFQTSATGTSYRLIAHVASTSASAYTLKVETSVSPTTYVYGTPITDWQSFTPTGSWTTNTTYTGKWRRVGDSKEYVYDLALAGAPTATFLALNLPNGDSIDTAKMSNALAGVSHITASGGKAFDGAAAVHNLVGIYGTATQVRVGYESTATGQLANVTQTAPFTFNSGDTLQFSFTVPIQGLSSSVQMSDQTDTRVVDFVGTVTSNTALTANVTNIPLTAEKDTHGAWSGTVFTVPVAGDYLANAGLQFTASASTSIIAYINGSSVARVGTAYASSVLSGSTALLANLKVGDTISFRSQGAFTTSAATTEKIWIKRISGPNAIAATEDVNCSYSLTSTQSASHNVVTTVVFNNKIFDSHNAFNTSTGIFTAPIAGKYRVSGRVKASIGTGVSYTQQSIITTTGTGGGSSDIAAVSPAGFSVFPTTNIVETISLNAGQTVKIDFYHFNSASASVTIQTSSNISIERVGN